jgi:hypothetical protein
MIDKQMGNEISLGHKKGYRAATQMNFELSLLPEKESSQHCIIPFIPYIYIYTHRERERERDLSIGRK